ncbi:type II toxin-antitoxin system VapC family toxin [Janibacter sp. G56]|uniref:type II toxin-antitoxin system VapC family toxin n=1 Tax=Janibacter sp. G56 TaxID=3418717 RepID=UPI003D08B223
MIIVDTSIWIDHLRSGVAQLVTLLQDGKVLGHPWVTGELALGNLAGRNEVLGLLHNLPQATVATDVEVMTLIGHHRLFGLGIGYVDAHLLASTKLSAGAQLWTRDKRLRATAVRLELNHRGSPDA